jgi:hypothetical protein
MIEMPEGMYVKGFTEISAAALAVLNEEGIFPKATPNGFESFFVPKGSSCLGILKHTPGNPRNAGRLEVA